MKSARLVFAALAVLVTCSWIGTVAACDKDKAAKAMMISASNGTCSAEKAAACTAEQAAACKAHARTSAVTASASGCNHGAATAVTASAGGCGDHDGAAAVTAQASGCAAHATTSAMTAAAKTANACCKSATAMAASANACAKSATAMSTVANNATKDCCAKDAATTAAKSAKGQRSMRILAAADGQCGGTGMAGIAAHVLHDGCEACADMAAFSDDLDAVGAERQVVRLKNGVMIVYSASSPSRVNAVQAAVSTRGEHLAHWASAGEKARLCNECRTIRGAMASGKLSREVVNIEGGTLLLLTSTDPAMVARVHAMADQKVATRIKS